MKNLHGVLASLGCAVLAAGVAAGAFAAAESGSGTHVDLDNTAVTDFWDCTEHVNPTYVWTTSDTASEESLDLRRRTSAMSEAFDIIRGEGTYRFRTALDDPKGPWRIRATDFISDKQARRSVEAGR